MFRNFVMTPEIEAARKLIPLQRIEHMAPGNYDCLKGWCYDQDVFVVACGSSLKDFDFSRLIGRNTIAVNRAAFYFTPSVWCWVDGEMARAGREHFGKNFEGFTGERLVAGHYGSLQAGGRNTVVKIGGSLNISNPGDSVLGRASSTMLGISIALIGRAKMIYILGLDAGFQCGKGHFHSDQFPHAHDASDKHYTVQSESFKPFAPWKHKIRNCNPKSNVKTFEFVELEKVLES